VELPLVVILLLTYAPEDKPERMEYALRAIQSTKDNLRYPNLGWYIADAGSSEKHFKEITNEFDRVSIWNYGGWHHESLSAGKSWNVGITQVFEQHADIYLRLEDDWVLKNPLDITKFVTMLTLRDDIGMVRLGYQHVPADMEAIGINGIHYLRYKKTTPFCYGGHPALIHRRFHDAYGYNDEKKNPGEIEIDMDYRVRNTKGPDIVRPQDIGGWGAFAHIGTKKGY
jgi:hypothetical protein